MAAKKAARRGSAKRGSTGRRRNPKRPANWARTWFVLRHLLLWSIVCVAAYWLWLDREVARTFETRQWSLPARVYARPLELYAGARIGPQRLIRELESLGYQRADRARSRGQYSASRLRVNLFSRGFNFWDFPESPRRVQIDFSGHQVVGIVNADDGVGVDLIRLEPVEIGRINPRQFEDRKLLVYADLPPQFVSALVAVEDRRFFAHHGVDVIGLSRAVVSNLRAKRFVQGGSTLTQQLVKNFYLTRERTLTRKLTEMMMSISLELRYDKSLILETYVNEVFLGQDGNRAIHGFGLAAQFYFGKPLDELDVPSMATLIGMVKGPTMFDPRRHPEAAKRRRDVVLNVMHERALIDRNDLERWSDQPHKLTSRGAGGIHANPAFMSVVGRQLLREYSADDLKSAGLNIFTTLDPILQADVEDATRETVAALESGGGVADLQAAAVVVEPRSGEILALVGDRNPAYAGFNRAADARRPIGSVIKPFVYAFALSEPRRYSLASMLEDKAVSWTDERGELWEPRNFDGRQYGKISMLDALTRSLNLATVDLGMQLGLDRVGDYLGRLGFETDLPAYPSMLLGAVELSPLQLAELYTPFANDGFQVPLRAILDVTDQAQHKLARYGLKIKSVMDASTAALVRHAMTRVITHGTGRRLLSDFAGALPLAGKTGTSDDQRDSWFVGFGANRLAAVWMGRDDNGKTELTGSSGALRLWSAALSASGIEGLSETLPPELSLQRIDLRRGVVIPPHCDNGEDVPIHRSSNLVTMPGCFGSGAPPAARPAPRRGLLDRLRSLFD